MTKHKTESYWYPDPIPGFDVLKWKQENQARILRETEGMTREEIRERERQAVERAKQRRAALAKSANNYVFLPTLDNTAFLNGFGKRAAFASLARHTTCRRNGRWI